MLDGSAVDKIAELATAGDHIKIVEGREFHVNSKGAVAVEFPRHSADEVFSISQVVSWIKNYLLTFSGLHLIVNVSSPDHVEVWDSEYNRNLEREALCESDFSGVYDKFPFGTQLSQEDFIIKLQTLFVATDARAQLMKTVAAVRAERVQMSDDDGVSQVAATRAGVVLTNKETIDNLWTLQTFQTFPEVEQPKIPYILRLHQREDELPKFALYPCDGGRWKVDSTIAVRAWLQEALTSSQDGRVVVL